MTRTNSQPRLRAALASIALFTGVAGAAVLATGCRGQVSDDSPIVLIRNMHDQPKYSAQNSSDFFDDGRAMRQPVEGTVSRDRFEDDQEIATGRTLDGSGYVMTTPDGVAKKAGGMEAVVSRGQQRFNIYCTPCHDKAGTGNGTVVQRGFQKPPSLHDARIRNMPDGQIYATIAHGVRNMPAYGAQVPTHDRWAIVAYVRALQLSQLSQLGGSK